MSGPRTRHVGELAVDLAIVVGSALYVDAASHYPSQGRQIPTLVGFLALAMGGLHLLAHVVPGLWKVTHDSQARARSTPRLPAQPPAAEGEPEAAAATVAAQPSAGPAPVALDVQPGEPRQVLVAVAWVVGLLLAVYVFGFEVAIPVFFLAYFGVMRAWRTALVSAVAMWGVTYGLFAYALAVPLPHGLV